MIPPSKKYILIMWRISCFDSNFTGIPKHFSKSFFLVVHQSKKNFILKQIVH